MKQLKNKYIRVLQHNPDGFGWIDVKEYEATSGFNAVEMSDALSPSGTKETLLNKDFREFRAANPGVGVKIANRTVKSPKTETLIIYR